MVSVPMQSSNSMLVFLFYVVPVFCSIRQLKWRQDHTRAGLIFPDPSFIRNISSVIRCLALCAQAEDCDGASYTFPTMVCRGHSLPDVLDISTGTTSPDTKLWMNGNCRRSDYMYIKSLDWCIKLMWTLWLRNRDSAKADCEWENARLVNVDSREKHNVLVRKLKHILLLPITTWWISGSKSGGSWKWDDGTKISQDADLWNTLPSVPFVSDCLCYFEQLIPIGKRFWPCVCLGSNGVICEEYP